MPLYPVRWPELSVAVVNARDQTDLVDVLDQVGDPSDCKIKLYDEPLYIGLELDVSPAKAEEPRHRVPEDVSRCTQSPSFALSGDRADTASEMDYSIVEFAFPNYTAYLKTKEADESDSVPGEVFERLCKNALLGDLEQFRPSGLTVTPYWERWDAEEA